MICMSLCHLKNMMMKINIFFCYFLVIILLSCSDKDLKYSGEVYKLKGGFGYKIFINERLAIKQDCIPALDENKPFNDSLSASIIMNLALNKMKMSQNPTITKEDLATNKIK